MHPLIASLNVFFNGFGSPWILTAISLGLLILSHIAAHFRIVYLDFRIGSTPLKSPVRFLDTL